MRGNPALDSGRRMFPSYADGLRVMLVDYDTTSLVSLTSMLLQHSYIVTKVELASTALSTIDEHQNEFKLIIANTKMPDMDTSSFLSALFQKHIPLILISSDMTTASASDFLTRGACFCLKKPVSVNEIKYLWQHALPKKITFSSSTPADQSNHTNLLTDAMMKNNESRVNDGTNWVETIIGPQNHQANIDRKGKRKAIEAPENIITIGGCSKNEQIEAFRATVRMQKADHHQLPSKGKGPITDEITRYENHDNRRRKFGELPENNHTREINKAAKDNHEEITAGEEKEKKAGENMISNGCSAVRKRGSVWNAELHRKFTAALCALGDKNARPKSILQMMNVPNLTQRQVASHLQKYKAQVQRLSETTATADNLKSTSKALENPSSNCNYPFKVSNLAENLLTSNSSWHPLGWRSSSPPVGKALQQSQKVSTSPCSISLQKEQELCPSPATNETANKKPEFCLGGKINLYKLPLFIDMMNSNNAAMSFTAVPQTTVSNPSAPYLPVPSATSNPGYASQTNLNQTGLVPTGTSPLAYTVPPNGSYAPQTELGQMGLVPCAESYIPSMNNLQSPVAYAPETNVNQMMGLDPFWGSYIPIDKAMPSATSYLQESALNPMDSVPYTTPCVLDDSLTPPSASGRSPMEVGEIMKLLDMDNIDDFSFRNGGDFDDELFDFINSFQNKSDAAA